MKNVHKLERKLHFFIVQSSLKVFDYTSQNSISILFHFRWAYFWIFDRWRILCARHGRCSWAYRHDWNRADPICSSSRTNCQPISNGCWSHSPMKSMDDESLNYTISKTLSIIILIPEEAYFIVLLCCLPKLAKVCQSWQHDKWK